MSEKEKNIIKTIAEALPKMSDFEKGYMVGVAETRAAEARDALDKKETEGTG